MHAYIPELKEQYLQGKISRREFIRMAALLGLSMSSIGAFLAACKPKETPTPGETPATVAPSPTPRPATPTSLAGPKRGGELRIAQQLLRCQDPASTEWTQFNVFRNVAEYLVIVDQDNVTRPWLLERWEVSDDLKTWTLFLRRGIHFNHGPEFTADDVVFNLQRWLNPDTGSAALGLMGDYLSPSNIEKVDAYTVRLHLNKPQIAVPEHLSHYQNAILSRDFEGDWLAQPVGTGPYTLEEYLVGERALCRRRDDYWRMGADGQPLPYMDSIRFLDLGTDVAAVFAALTTGEVDLAPLQPPMLDALEGYPDILIATQVSSYTHVIRMRADRAPFDDVRVRNAIKACQDRQRIREATMREYGALGEDHHVAPIHPEYCPMEPPPRDIEKARALLAEAGYQDGLTVSLAVIDMEPNITIAQLLKEQCEPAGINIELNIMPASMYWDQWMEVDFGITSWTHRPLAIMTLALAYKTGVPWNETHWSNARFDELLTQAEQTLDIEQRRQIMCEIQTLMKEEGPVAIPRWGAFLWGHHRKVRNYRGAPHDAIMLDEVWLDEEV